MFARNSKHWQTKRLSYQIVQIWSTWAKMRTCWRSERLIIIKNINISCVWIRWTKLRCCEMTWAALYASQLATSYLMTTLMLLVEDADWRRKQLSTAMKVVIWQLIIDARYISNQSHYRLVRPSLCHHLSFKLYFDVVVVRYAFPLYTGTRSGRWGRCARPLMRAASQRTADGVTIN